MSEVDAKPPQENPLTNIIVNVLVPIMALTMMSDDPAILRKLAEAGSERSRSGDGHRRGSYHLGWQVGRSADDAGRM